jgi:hypothetical protein
LPLFSATTHKFSSRAVLFRTTCRPTYTVQEAARCLTGNQSAETQLPLLVEAGGRIVVVDINGAIRDLDLVLRELVGILWDQLPDQAPDIWATLAEPVQLCLAVPAAALRAGLVARDVALVEFGG